MRNKNRIDPFMQKLTVLWKEQCPDWRFGQLISNIADFAGRDIFFIEDEEMMSIIKIYFNEK